MILIVPLSATVITLYPNPTNISDTSIARIVANDTWADIHDGTGNYFNPSATTLYATIQGANQTGSYAALNRVAMIFNASNATTPPPVGSTINSATVGIWITGTRTTLADTGINIYKYTPDAAWDNSDYTKFGRTNFSTTINVSTMSTGRYYNFSLNTNGISNLSLSSVFGIGVRTTSDADDIYPGWAWPSAAPEAGVYIQATDAVTHPPFIEIDYSEPSTLPESISGLTIAQFRNTTSTVANWTNHGTPSGIQIWRNNVYYANLTSGESSLIWIGLSRSTTYTISTRTYNSVGYNATWVNASVTTGSKPVTGANYSFFHGTDWQNMGTSTSTYAYDLTFSALEDLKDDYNISRIMITGDLTNGPGSSPSNPLLVYNRYTNASLHTTIPILPITGNHDLNNTATEWTWWDAGIPNGASYHNYGELYNNFVIYGLQSVSDAATNATAKGEMQSYFAAHPDKFPIILEHAYMNADGSMLGAGTEIRNALFRDSLVLTGHTYSGSTTTTNLMRQTPYNGSIITEDLFNQQNVAWFNYSGGRMYTAWVNGSELWVTTNDFYFYPDYLNNNTQNWRLGYLVVDTTPPASITNLQNSTPTSSAITWTWTNPGDSDFNITRVYRNNTFYENVGNASATSIWSSLPASTAMTISTHTCDLSMNCNTTWVNRTATTEATATGTFTQQDIYLSPEFLLTIHYVDVNTNAPLTTVIATTSSGQSFTTTNGTAYFNEPYSIVVVYSTSSGYNSAVSSYIMDQDRTVTIQLTPATTTSLNNNVIYQAQLYRFMFRNLVGTPLGGLSVRITPINLTMNSSWTSQLLGISPSVDIQNGVIMGTTGSDGSFGCPLITPMNYYVNISGTAYSGDTVDYSIMEYPPSTQTDILISLPTDLTTFPRLTPTPAFISYNLFNQSINETGEVISVNYYDPSGATNLTIVTVSNQSGHVFKTTTYTGPAASNIVNNYTYNQGTTSPEGDSLSYGFSAYVPTAGGWNNISQSLVFNRGSSFTGSATYNGWIAIILIVFVASAFTASTVYIGTIGVGLMGLFFYYGVKWFTPSVPGTAFVAMCCFWICIGAIGFIMKKTRSTF